MNKDMIKGKWNEMQGDIKARWGQLTDDELTQVEGNYDKLVGTIQKKYGFAKDKVERELDEFFAAYSHVDTPATTPTY
jgi:uncharacterized protein YjbJ (UPF0337 family)